MQAPRLSIVLPLVDDRGFAGASVGAWASQTLPAALYEIVAVDDGRRPRYTQELRRHLRDQDVLVERAGGSEIELYQKGAEVARGDLLLFTESHAVPLATTAEKLLCHFGRTGVETATLRSTHLPRPGLAALEEALGDRVRHERPPERWWAGVSLRGLAVSRSLFHELGGFRTELERFAETALAIEMDRRGLRADEVPDAVVQHGDCRSVRELEPALLALGRGRRRYVEAGPRARVEPYVGAPGPGNRAVLDAGLARSLSLALLRSLLDPTGGAASRTAGARALLRWAPIVVAGAAGAALRPRVSARLSFLLCAVPLGNAASRLARFARAWSAVEACGEVQLLSRGALPPPGAPTRPLRFRPGESEDTDFVGFHAREADALGSFRWSEPAALWRLALAPGDYVGTLRVSVPPFDPGLRLLLNGRARAGRATPEGVEITLPRHCMREGGEQHLVLLSAPFRPARAGSTDGRTLGVAVRGLDLVPRASGALAGLP
jgi:hypothetical protein